jgi:hypothetical protein
MVSLTKIVLLIVTTSYTFDKEMLILASTSPSALFNSNGLMELLKPPRPDDKEDINLGDDCFRDY